MIGINLLYSREQQKPQAILSSPRVAWPGGLSEFFTIHDAAENKGTLIFDCILPYPDYPLRHYRADFYEYVIEGYVYNATGPEIKNELDQWFTHQAPDIAGLQQLTSTWSGEFVLIIKTKGTFLIINDSLGRLPLFLLQASGTMYVGRSLFWLHQHIKLTLDKTAVLELLWSSYPLHFKTLYKGVMRCKGGSVIELDTITGVSRVHEGVVQNYDERVEDSLDQSAYKLDRLLDQACQRITQTVDKLPVNISLSGGQDSRVAAFYFSRINPEVVSSSFTYPGAEADVWIAEKVAHLLGIKWKNYSVSRSEEADTELLKLKMGQNYIGLSFLIDYFKQIRLDFPNGSLLITGDGGDKLLPYHGEVQTGISFDHVVQKIANRHSVIPLTSLCKVFGWHEMDFLHHLSGILMDYPERVPNNKSIHFTMYEKVHQSFFEGEDRNRHYGWSTTPFYDLDVFRYAMAIQDRHKRYYSLYRHLLNQLPASLNAIPDASGTTVNHPAFVLRRGFHEFFRATSPQMKTFLKTIAGKRPQADPGDSGAKQKCLAMIKHNPLLDTILDVDQFAHLLNRATHDQFLYLLTLSRLSRIL